MSIEHNSIVFVPVEEWLISNHSSFIPRTIIAKWLLFMNLCEHSSIHFWLEFVVVWRLNKSRRQSRIVYFFKFHPRRILPHKHTQHDRDKVSNKSCGFLCRVARRSSPNIRLCLRIRTTEKKYIGSVGGCSFPHTQHIS